MVAGVGGTSDDDVTSTTADRLLDNACVDDRSVLLAVAGYVMVPHKR